MKDFCGFIYIWINTYNGMIYIGKTQNLEQRLYKYKNNNFKRQKKFYAAVSKYGWNAFKFEIIEKVSTIDIDKKEQFWIKHLYAVEFGYNLTYGGQGAPSGDLHPNKKQENKDKISKTMTGKSKSKSHCENISKSKKGIFFGPNPGQAKRMMENNPMKNPLIVKKCLQSRKQKRLQCLN